jgi:YegS/Rv2252/BmrU family lipid kinase
MNLPQWYFIINPVAGNGRGSKYWRKIQLLLKASNIDFDFGISTYPQHSTHLASYAVLKGHRYIAAVGGDGTINEVINGIFNQQKVPTDSITFAVIPIGTGNDWVKTHKIPTKLKEAVQLLRQAKVIKHDIGKVTYHNVNSLKKEHRFFINVAGLAYDAFVTKATETRPKYGNSKLYYLYLILRCVTQFKATPATISFNDQELSFPFFNITIGQCIHNGGGTNLVPHADPTDGLFALSLYKNIKPWEVILRAPMFYNGSIAKHKEAVTAQTKHLKITAPSETPAFVEVDGEWLGQSPIEFIMLPAAIKVIVP